MYFANRSFSSVISVAPSPMGNLFATGSGDMKARIWRYSPHPHNGL
jgi:glucose repression regulatory protein TUP1